MNPALKLLALVSMIPIFLWSGCQQEVTEIINNPNDQVITPDAEVADLVKRVAMKDGSADNIIDHSSCISLVFPVTVIVNDIHLIIEKEEDLYTVEHIIDKYDDDEDNIEIIFPVTVNLADYTELVINNEDEFEDLIDDCPESEPDLDIECIDFVYPLTISVFDTENQLSEIVTVENDKDLYDFFEDLEDDELASFNFPIFLVDFNGDHDVVRDIGALEELFAAAEGVCDEDDDNDHNDDDVSTDYFKSILTYGDWIIYHYSYDPRYFYYGYKFNFLENGVVEISYKDQVSEGTWYVNGDAGWIELELDIDEELEFDELDDDWHIISYDASGILISEEDENEGLEGFFLQRRYYDGSLENNLANTLKQGTWAVSNYTKYGEDKIEDFSDISLDFQEDGSLVAYYEDETVAGTWSIETMGALKFILDFGEFSPMNEFNDKYWDIVMIYITQDGVELFYFDPEYGTITDILILEKL
jgi:hypothetical protein